MSTPPHWDLTNIYPSLESKEFKSAFSKLKKKIKLQKKMEMSESVVSKIKPLPTTKPPTKPPPTIKLQATMPQMLALQSVPTTRPFATPMEKRKTNTRPLISSSVRHSKTKMTVAFTTSDLTVAMMSFPSSLVFTQTRTATRTLAARLVSMTPLVST